MNFEQVSIKSLMEFAFFLQPVAAGSGIPQIKCFLNGVKIPHVVDDRFGDTFLAVQSLGLFFVFLFIVSS